MHPSSANTVTYRRFLLSTSDCFLDGSHLPRRGINYFIQVPENVNNALGEFYTLLADLQQPLESLWQNVYHRTRSEIQSFLNNQTFTHKVTFHLSDTELEKFMDLLDHFLAFKKIRRAERFRLKAYNRKGLLAVSFIRQHNELICINFYRVTQQRASNLYSFHLKHALNGRYNNTHLGRAHRSLHWLDMLEFKKLGVACYDFCGWYHGKDDPHRLNINAFKEQFTRHLVKEYSGVIYNNRLLRLLMKLKQNI